MSSLRIFIFIFAIWIYWKSEMVDKKRYFGKQKMCLRPLLNNYLCWVWTPDQAPADLLIVSQAPSMLYHTAFTSKFWMSNMTEALKLFCRLKAFQSMKIGRSLQKCYKNRWFCSSDVANLALQRLNKEIEPGVNPIK